MCVCIYVYVYVFVEHICESVTVVAQWFSSIGYFKAFHQLRPPVTSPLPVVYRQQLPYVVREKNELRTNGTFICGLKCIYQIILENLKISWFQSMRKIWRVQ
uniref:Bm13483, isoform b n=1 Tax=Brugia malayi TaxID=6279 RepID=A0A1I9G314_BRUMA|nr:Bm13483, isoform b [Brugia malayi]